MRMSFFLRHSRLRPCAVSDPAPPAISGPCERAKTAVNNKKSEQAMLAPIMVREAGLEPARP